MKSPHFTLVEACPMDTMHLVLSYADGAVFNVDIARVIKGHRSLRRIRDVFGSAAVGDHGLSVVWDRDDRLELAADNLRARAIEHAGGFSHETILNWMARHGLTLDQAAGELGLSRRMLAYYRSGAKPVPRTVGLACLGWEAAQQSEA